MARSADSERSQPDAVAAYKRLLAEIIDRRPSGTRQRLAAALSKNRSFVSQIANPAYATPIPASHLETIFEVCHFSAAERREFLERYQSAHPRKLLSAAPPRGTLAVALPDLGDAGRNRLLHELVSAVVRDIAKLVGAADGEHKGRGKRR
jgi:hypothetical protein